MRGWLAGWTLMVVGSACALHRERDNEPAAVRDACDCEVLDSAVRRDAAVSDPGVFDATTDARNNAQFDATTDARNNAQPDATVDAASDAGNDASDLCDAVFPNDAPGHGVIITTQAELEALRGVRHILGSLFLLPEGAPLDLSPLGCLEDIGSELLIQNTAGFSTLHGFDHLTRVAGSIDIEHNPEIERLDGLEALSHVGNNVMIHDNAALQSVAALSGVHETASLRVSECPQLHSLRGIILRSVGNIALMDNASMTEVNVLSNSITTIDGLTLAGMPLTDLSGFAEIATDTGWLHIERMSALRAIDWPLLSRVDGEIHIVDNPTLSTINLPALASTGDTSDPFYTSLWIARNQQLAACETDQLVARVGGYCMCEGNTGTNTCD